MMSINFMRVCVYVMNVQVFLINLNERITDFYIFLYFFCLFFFLLSQKIILNFDGPGAGVALL